MKKKEYKKINALFKEFNFDLYEWVLQRAKEEDISLSSFIIRALKKVRNMENLNNDKKKVHN